MGPGKGGGEWRIATCDYAARATCDWLGMAGSGGDFPGVRPNEVGKLVSPAGQGLMGSRRSSCVFLRGREESGKAK